MSAPVPGSRREPATISASDRGFLLGDGLFETVRVRGGRPFRLETHLARLARGARRAGIALPSDLEPRIRAFLEDPGGAPPAANAALRVTASRGEGGDVAGDGAGEATIALGLRPLEGAPAGEPPALRAVLEGRLHEEALSSGLKAVGYLERVLALRAARGRGADEALLQNAAAELVEGSTSNLIAVVGEARLVAPGPPQGALDGVTRGVVLEEAKALGLEVEERGLEPGEIGELDELLLTSSLRGVAAVVRVEGTPVGRARPGPVARGLREAHEAAVERETG